MRLEEATVGHVTGIDYFVKWGHWRWRKPVTKALNFMGDLRGRSVLEIGGADGRMSALFALLGARVTMLQKGSPATAEFLRSAEDELDKWGVRERVRIKVTDGSLEAVKNERFDIVFTKSVLWSIPDLDTFLDDMECSLAEHGKVAFVENMHGGPAVMWMRRKLRPGFTYENRYFGIQRRQLPYFRERFDDVKISLHRFTVYTILGSKSSRFGQTGRPSAEPTEELELEYRLR